MLGRHLALLCEPFLVVRKESRRRRSIPIMPLLITLLGVSSSTDKCFPAEEDRSAFERRPARRVEGECAGGFAGLCKLSQDPRRLMEGQSGDIATSRGHAGAVALLLPTATQIGSCRRDGKEKRS